jgi:hypothetical protein
VPYRVLLLLWCCSENYKLYFKKDFILFCPPTSKNPLVSSGMKVYCGKNPLYFYFALLKIFWKKSGNQTIKKLVLGENK